MPNNIHLTTLPSGLRVISNTVDSVESVAIGAWINVGTRHETPSENGIAHMVEHMLFKGTTSRNAQQIAEDIENVGGNVNAYTSREITSYHVHLLKEDVTLAAEILSDMIQNSILPDSEIERERQVILQEIGMNNDTPDDLIFDQSMQRAYHNQMMGAPILGQVNIIENMKKTSLKNFIDTHYTAKNMVISASGNINHDTLVKLAETHFANLPDSAETTAEKSIYTGGETTTTKDLEQAHVILGFQGIPRDHNLYYSAQALSSIMGGGMSSRLFQEVREKRGLAYSIFSFHSAHTDAGFFGIYSGCAPTDLTQLTDVLCHEVKKSLNTITNEEFTRAKTQMKSNILMGRESMMRRTDQHAKHLLLSGNMYNQADMVQKIENMTKETIIQAAEQIFKTTPTLCTLGPEGHAQSYKDISEKLAA